ncbi:MAG TPA: nitronate monooxygenase [Nitrospiria bacterium]
MTGLDKNPSEFDTPLTRHAGITVPLICGAMYPCSNPELVAAVSEAGGIGIVQPISLTYVHGHDFREGLRLIRRLTPNPIGMNALIEGSSKIYRDRMSRWIDIALEEGIRFFITSLGKPDWVAERVHAEGGIVYHDATDRIWAEKGRDSGVDGLIAVNKRAGGHAGSKSAEELIQTLGPIGLPVVCAGGIGTEHDFTGALQLGYAGVQMGTRFIATHECRASPAYKAAILNSGEKDIILSERLTGVPLSVIRTPYIEQMGTRAGSIARRMLKGRKTKHLMRMIYSLKSLFQLKKASLDPKGKKEFWQAGKSVAGIDRIEAAGEIVRRFAAAVKKGQSK